MTKLERLKQKLERLVDEKNTALKQNNLMALLRINAKIEEINDDIAEAEQYEPQQLSAALKNYGEDVKNRVYKALLECSLAADLLNDCSENVKSELKKIGLDDFHFREDIENMCKLSQSLALLVIIPGQTSLTDMICDNADYIDKCHAAADSHLAKKLKL